MNRVSTHRKLILTCVFGVLSILTCRCQDSTARDAQDWLLEHKVIKSRRLKNNFLFVLPVVGANPAAGFIYGLGLTYATTPAGEGARSSNLSSNASYSTKGLANLNVKTNLFLLKSRLFLNGDWRLMVISETTHGLATATGAPGQSLRYGFARFHETGSWRLAPNFFAGMGIHFDRQFRIDDHTLDSGGDSISYHYRYSVAHGFNPREYTTAGLSLNLLYDSRDNPIDAYKGVYANINYRVNAPAFGSDQNSTLLLADCRAFIPLDGARSRHILALWGYGNFVASGNVPYLMLPAIGYDQRQRTGRGYTFGRFRGEQLLYGESEYRYPISQRSGILSGVVFLNVTSTSDTDHHIPVLEYIQPAGGAGLRLLLDKVSRTRLQLDYALGKDGSALYFGIRETF